MSIDLSQFVGVFLEESYEGLEVMESSLLSLDSADEETINTIFRAAHSIKGGAGTFGFSDVTDFTHLVETLLDKMRQGQQAVVPPLVNLLLEAVDCIRMLLEATQDGPKADAAVIAQVQGRLQQALDGQIGESPAVDKPASATVEAASEVALAANVAGEKCWKIEFKPDEDLLQSGHEPAFMFEALAELGKLRVTAEYKAVPDLCILDPEKVYLKWNLELVSDCSREEIEDVFAWVVNGCQLIIGEPAVNPISIPNEPTVKESTHNEYSPENSTGADTWVIDFRPYETLLSTGNEPRFIFEALAELGRLSVKMDDSALPELSALNPDNIYLSWTAILESNCSEEDIREAFEWVEDECDLLLSRQASTHPAVDVTAEVSAEPPVSDTVFQAERAPVIGPSPVTEKPEIEAAGTAVKAKGVTNNSIRVDTDKIDALINRVGELVITQAMLVQIGNELADWVPGPEIQRLQIGLEQLERNTRDLQDDVMRVRMLPISFVFNRFPRLVHDVSGKLGKKVELVITGEQTEIDKTVMEKIVDPMVHLVRNSLDHGLEPPEERTATGKPEIGKIELNAYHQGGFVIIDISDDGRGLNTEKIFQKASENGLVTVDQALSDSDINELIFKPGFSTADAVGDLSGRGVGMDVVRRNIESLGGHISVQSEPGCGSVFSVRLPLTLAILDGQLINVHDEIYIIPLVSIVETIIADKNSLSPIAGKRKLLYYRGEYVPLLNLRSLFKLPPIDGQMETHLVVIVENGGERVGLVVDELCSQQQVVIKSLEANFKRIEGFAGATILGDGRVALILDIAGLMKRGLDYEIAQAAKKRNDVLRGEGNIQGAMA
ncbi:MAG: chemotaxis protein CheA [Neptuniibacter caesariensis]|uniref:Chemotaxis protein CheA n=1 Tax=Neptuniibacter caesariensis TaxID=207954 RepID=A0A2G6JQ32_NEPCE|nr:MAG: chemotaxis protein CheA [Neptuniibacter caesariensis]